MTYRVVKGVRNGNGPLTNHGNAQKPVNPPYWVKGASYEAGDVVIYQITNTYYQATVQIHNSVESPDNDKQKWHRLNTTELNEIIEEHKSKDFCDIDNKDEGDWTAGEEKARCGALEKQWNAGQVIEPGGYAEDPMNPGRQHRHVYSSPLQPNAQEDNARVPGGIVRNYWKKTNEAWDTNGMYFKGDIVSYTVNGKKLFYQVPQRIDGVWNPSTINTGWSKGFESIEELLGNTNTLVTYQTYS